jgi:hypothetical protein
MSRLRGPFLYDRYIFVTFDLLKLRMRVEDWPRASASG